MVLQTSDNEIYSFSCSPTKYKLSKKICANPRFITKLLPKNQTSLLIHYCGFHQQLLVATCNNTIWTKPFSEKL